MKKRAFERIPSNLVAKFYCSNTTFYGILTNLSENGMCFKTVMYLPSESIPPGSGIKLLVNLKKDSLEVPVKVVRIAKTGGFCDTMGVELLEQPSDYLEFIKKSKSHLSNLVNPLTPSLSA
jgi:hypothetical protein